MIRIICTVLIVFLSLNLISCATPTKLDGTVYYMTPQEGSLLQQGKKYFVEQYYRKAMKILLPLACNGNPEAQYAVGYMYYYGYGVTQDTEVGFFWIEKSAAQNYEPAIRALPLMRG